LHMWRGFACNPKLIWNGGSLNQCQYHTGGPLRCLTLLILLQFIYNVSILLVFFMNFHEHAYLVTYNFENIFLLEF
jgi:hypothetical protein